MLKSALDNWELHLINMDKCFSPASASAVARISDIKVVWVCSIIMVFEEISRL